MDSSTTTTDKALLLGAGCELAHSSCDTADVLPLAFTFATHGTLQALSMTNRHWLVTAYQAVPSVWQEIDMSAWPFALNEYRREGDRMKGLQQSHEAGFASSDVSSRVDDQSMGLYLGEVRPRSDSLASDLDLRNALKRIPKGSVNSLTVFSSCLTNAGMAEALQDHGTNLALLCIGSGGSQSLSGKCLATLSSCAHLKTLEVHDISGLPLAKIAQACNLQHLYIRFDHRSAILDVNAICKFTYLQVLKITVASTGRSGLPWQPFWGVFASCKSLRVINLYGSVEVSNGMLLCVMNNFPTLEEFVGSRFEWGAGPREDFEFPFPDGPRVVDMSDLDADVVKAFRCQYQAASRIFIDDVFGATYSASI